MSAMRLDAQLTRGAWVSRTQKNAENIEDDFDVAIINLGSRGLDGPSLIAKCRERGIARVVGFCGHLEVEIRRAAKAAGIDKILTNENALSDLLNHL
jgi:methylmalonyl-CoA mutase cobalamin-binding subunit